MSFVAVQAVVLAGVCIQVRKVAPVLAGEAANWLLYGLMK